jgi:ribosomal protein S18 acetylase RimI-like enzyme
LKFSSLSIRRIRTSDIASTARVWHDSKQAEYTYLPLQQAMTLEEDTIVFRDRVIPGNDTWVAVKNGAIVGFLTLSGSYVARLYVDPGYQGSGVGSALLDHAKQLSPTGLELHTHQRNLRARGFYESREFVAVKFGISPAPENEPDVEYHWRPA